MITDERISTFIHSLDTGNTPFLTELERYAKETNVPVIRPQMQSFLKVLLAMQQPKQILEVGTAIGFSALLMAEYGPADCHITTIEKYEKRIPLALSLIHIYPADTLSTLSLSWVSSVLIFPDRLI